MKKQRLSLNGEAVPPHSDMQEISSKDYARFRIPSVSEAKKIPIHLVNRKGKVLEVIDRRGGKREGSGRKASGRKPITIRLLPKAKKRLEVLAGKKHCSLSEVVETLILR